jgi:histidinol dehydrogenase
MRIIDLSAGLDFRQIDDLLESPDEQELHLDHTVRSIVADVRQRGDAAVCDYTRKFDDHELAPGSIRVSEAELKEMASGADDELVDILKRSVRHVTEFHEQEKSDSWEYYAGDGIRLGMRIMPLDSAGVYIPGGKATYPSSVIMSVVPARVAGVERIVAVTPPRSLEESPLVAAALDVLGVHEVYRVGGPQAIAALAFGTETIPRVDKIVGPGNQFVQTAKRMVFGTVDIDMVAGPSEVAVVADETCDPAWVAADLLAQAEQDEMSGIWLICWSKETAAAVFDQIQVQLESLDRAALARAAIVNRGVTFIVSDEEGAIDLVNYLAAAHVEVLMAEPERITDGIKHAGSIFIGRYAPSSVGHYFAGPSHVLPTGRSARFFSPLGVSDFMKKTAIVRYSGRAIERFGEMIEKFAIAEGLTGNARAITIRRGKA